MKSKLIPIYIAVLLILSTSFAYSNKSLIASVYCSTLGSWIRDISCVEKIEEKVVPMASSTPTQIVKQYINNPVIETVKTVERIVTSNTPFDPSDYVTKDFLRKQAGAIGEASGKSTSNLSETISSLTTTDISEGTNLYYTDARVAAYISASTTLGSSGSSQWTTSGSNIYYSSGSVGIGTTSPWGQLSVNPNGITGPAFVVGSSTATSFVIDNSGFVGVGTASVLNPSGSGNNKMEILGSNRATSVGNGVLGLYTSNDMAADLGASIVLGGVDTTGGTGNRSFAAIAGRKANSTSGNREGYLQFAVRAAGSGSTQMTEFMRLNGNGNLGIGTTSPFATLAINPTAGNASNQFVVGSSTATSFIINNSGQVGIGTSTPSETLEVTGTIKYDVLNSGIVAVIASSTAKTTYFRASADNNTARGAALQAAFAASAAGDTIIIGPGNYKLTAQLDVLSYQNIILQSSHIYGKTGADGTSDIFEAASTDYWRIEGNGILEGNGLVTGTYANEAGIRVSGSNCIGWSISGLNFTSFKGPGIAVVCSNSVHNNGSITQVNVTNSSYGFNSQSGAEYININDSTFNNNTTGMYIGAGNVSVAGGNVSDNTTGIYIDNPGNNGHGMFVGVNINHNGTDGLYANAVTIGMDFIGCHFFGSRITLDSSRGINIIGGMGSPTFNMVGTPTGYSFVKDFWFNSAEPTITATVAQRPFLRIEQSYTGTNATSTSNYGVQVDNGGTGTTTLPTYGQILVGNNSGGYQYMATSSLGISAQWSTSGSNISYNSGNVGIGTSSAAAKLGITQSANTAANGHWQAGTDGDFRSVYVSDTSGTLSFFGGDTAGSLNTATLNSAGAWTNASDRSYKENIVDLNTKYTLDTLLSIQPRFYTMKGTGKPQIGFIAQELKLVLPEVVEGTDGSMGISYGNMVALLVTAVKELNGKVEKVASDIKAIFAEKVETKEVVTEKLCVGNTCITEDELKDLLDSQNIKAKAPTIKENVGTTTESNQSTTTEEVVESNDNATSTEEVIDSNTATSTPVVEEQSVSKSVEEEKKEEVKEPEPIKTEEVVVEEKTVEEVKESEPTPVATENPIL